MTGCDSSFSPIIFLLMSSSCPHSYPLTLSLFLSFSPSLFLTIPLSPFRLFLSLYEQTYTHIIGSLNIWIKRVKQVIQISQNIWFMWIPSSKKFQPLGEIFCTHQQNLFTCECSGRDIKEPFTPTVIKTALSKHLPQKKQISMSINKPIMASGPM